MKSLKSGSAVLFKKEIDGKVLLAVKTAVFKEVCPSTSRGCMCVDECALARYEPDGTWISWYFIEPENPFPFISAIGREPLFNFETVKSFKVVKWHKYVLPAPEIEVEYEEAGKICHWIGRFEQSCWSYWRHLFQHE